MLKNKKRLGFGITILFLILLSAFVIGVTTTPTTFSGASTTGFSSPSSSLSTGSFSQVNAQYFSPSIGGSYNLNSFSGYMSGPVTQGNEDQSFFDMQLFIPPFSCEPAVVRSDLLEEQNVPVFCRLTSLKLNPGIDITRIERLSITTKEDNPYIAGVGFHPARAAIASLTSSYNSPTSDNLGYVVVVLKRQETEQQMPDNVTVTLAASVQYGANNAYGIGENEFYLPVLTDAEFSNNIYDYSFFNGQGYIRVEDISENSAIVSIYSSANVKIYSDRIEKGRTSNDFYLPNGYWGQRMRITLKEITIPQTKAKFSVNGRNYEAYEGQKFYDGKCTLVSATAITGGTGNVKIRCGSQSYDLKRSFNQVNFIVGSSVQKLGIGEKVDTSLANNYYLVHVGKITSSDVDYVILAKVSDSSLEGVSGKRKLSSLISDLDNKVSKGADPNNYISTYNTKSKIIKLVYLNEGAETEGIKFSSLLVEDTSLVGESSEYFEKTLGAYDYVKDNYGGQQSNEAGFTQYTYGALSLWKQYELADWLGQKEKRQEILSRIFNEYPSSLWKGRNSETLLTFADAYSDEGSSAYNEKDNIAVTLLSVNDPSREDISADVTFSIGAQGTNSVASAFIGKDLTEDTIYNSEYSLVVKDIAKDYININYSCPVANSSRRIESKTARITKTTEITGCRDKIKITLTRSNLREIARVVLTPNVYGRSRENNFSFSIGIEKRPDSLTLTPQEASAKMQELAEQIAEIRNITEDLAEVIRVGKIGCWAVTNLMNLKNLFNGMSGGSSARTEVMRYWNQHCESIEYQKQQGVSNVDDCIAKNGAQIEKEVTAMQGILQQVNNEITAAKSAQGNSANDNIALDYRINQDRAQLSGITLLESEGKNVTTIGGATILSIIDKLSSNSTSFSEYAEMRKNYLVMTNEAFSQKTKDAASMQLYANIVSVKARQDTVASQSKSLLDVDNNIRYSVISNPKQGTVSIYNGYKWGLSPIGDYTKEEDVELTQGTPIAFERKNNKNNLAITYVHVLQSQGEDFVSISAYKISNQTSKKVVKLDDSDSVLTGLVFQNRIAYNNRCQNCNFMKVFTLEPNRGMPALLPFDAVNGWYVQTKQLFPGYGERSSYQDSGKLNSFWLCNVGQDGFMEGVGTDDICARFDLYTGNSLDSFAGLTENEAKALIQKAIQAVQKAQEQLTRNPQATHININGISLRVQGSEGDSGSKCTDSMSVRDCQIIFNFCDPFVCPTSRCDFGGEYQVDNVIQSGVIGSTLLCLPNFIGLPNNKENGVVLPVCVTGIHAGLNAWADILESYRDCLNESITTNRTVGICDEIQSFYACDLFWRQIQPFAQALFRNVFLTLSGNDKSRGGGEYLFTQDSWNNMEKSSANMNNYYGANSNLQFGVDSIATAAISSDDVCQMALSATYPNSFDAMLEPESPVQFHAFFEEATYTTATVPASSRYKVFYVISAGNDSGHYYTVYLKSSPTSLGYTSKPMQVVATGYVQQGGRASETRDFIDVSGFQQVCVRIDTQEECGFKSVSTSAALNYLKDEAVSQQASSSVTTETECVAGSQYNAGAFLTPNIGQGVNQFVNPDLYNQGVIRVCASRNPGEGTQPNRWENVGYCDQSSVRCWLDKNSVENAIQGAGIENMTLAEAQQLGINNLLNSSDTYLAGDQASDAVTKFLQVYNWIADKITNSDKINEAYTGDIKDSFGNTFKGKTISNLEEDWALLDARLVVATDRARLAFGKAALYEKIAKNIGRKTVVATVEEQLGYNPYSGSDENNSTVVAENPYSYISVSSDLIEVSMNEDVLLKIRGTSTFYLNSSGSEVLIGSYNTGTKKITILSSRFSLVSESDKSFISDLNGAVLSLDGIIKLL